MKKTICDFCGKILWETKPNLKGFGTYMQMGHPKAEEEVSKDDFPYESRLSLNDSEVLICHKCAERTAIWIKGNLTSSNPSKREEEK